MTSTDLKREIDQLIAAWFAAKKAADLASRKLDIAQEQVRLAEHEVGKRLVPLGAKNGEPFNIWVRHENVEYLLFACSEITDYRTNDDGDEESILAYTINVRAT